MTVARSRTRPPAQTSSIVVLGWKTVSPSAELMVDPRNGARAVIRDTGVDAGRFHWSVLTAGELDPLSEGRTDDLVRAQSLAEAALRAYAENRLEMCDGHVGDVMGLLGAEGVRLRGDHC